METTQRQFLSNQFGGLAEEEPFGDAAALETPNAVSDDAMVEDTSPTEAAPHARDEEEHSLRAVAESAQQLGQIKYSFSVLV